MIHSGDPCNTTSTPLADTSCFVRVSSASRSKLCCHGILMVRWAQESHSQITFPLWSPRRRSFPLTQFPSRKCKSQTLQQRLPQPALSQLLHEQVLLSPHTSFVSDKSYNVDGSVFNQGRTSIK